MKEFTGKFNVQSAKIGIVVADFNETVTKQLVQGATEMLAKFDLENVDVYHVPGAFEIPFMTKQLLTKKEYDGILTLGAIIKGETDHYDLIC